LPVRLRPVTPADAPAIAAIYGPVVRHTSISFEAVAPSDDEIRKRIAAVFPQRPWLVAEDDDAVLGYAYASEFRSRAAYRWSVETSVYIAAAAQRHGIGRRLYTALFALLDALGYRRAFVGITLPNDASVGLHHALGFTDVGVLQRAGFKFGRYHDVASLERSLGTDPQPPDGEPRSFATLSPAFAAEVLSAHAGPST
jgi:L-amino acid N-acyltransferase YncA